MEYEAIIQNLSSALSGLLPRFIEAARKLNIYPLITKHNRAGKGLGVQLFQNEEELAAYVKSPLFEHILIDSYECL